MSNLVRTPDSNGLEKDGADEVVWEESNAGYKLDGVHCDHEVLITGFGAGTATISGWWDAAGAWVELKTGLADGESFTVPGRAWPRLKVLFVSADAGAKAYLRSRMTGLS